MYKHKLNTVFTYIVTLLTLLVSVCFAENIDPNDDGSTVTDNTAYNNGNSTTGGIYVYGIKAYSGSTVTGNTVRYNGDSASVNVVYGIHAGSGSTVTGNTVHDNGDSAGGIVYGIDLIGNSLLYQNTVFSNGTRAGSATNIDACVSCRFVINHAL